jgi:hypothetical protein
MHTEAISRSLEQIYLLQARSVAIQELAEERHVKLQRNKTIGNFYVANYGDHFDRVPEKIPGTCEWLGQDETYCQWLDQSTSSAHKILIVAAGPGWGKSVLSKDLVNRRLKADLGTDWTACHFFFHYNHGGMNTAGNALRAIIHRLLSEQRHLVDDVTERVAKFNKDASSISVSDLTNVFLGAISSAEARPLVCVIDALDECLDDELATLVRFLRRARQIPRVRFVVTTRPWPNIIDELERELELDRMVIAAEKLQQDLLQQEILLVMSHRLEEILRNRFDENTRTKLRTALTTKVEQGERTYLWLKLVLDSLKSARLKADVQRLMNQPPKRLYDAYSMLLSRVEPENRDRLNVLLRLVMVAERPLTLAEASVAVLLRTRHPQSCSFDDLNAESDTPGDFGRWVVETSGFFISVYNNRLYFIHQTCKEYLTRKVVSPSAAPRLGTEDVAEHSWFASSTTETQAHATAAECCLLALVVRPAPSKEALEMDERHYDGDGDLIIDEGHLDAEEAPGNRFMRYAAAFLTYHFGLCQRYESGVLVDIESALCLSYTEFISGLVDSGRCCLEIYSYYRRYEYLLSDQTA